MCIFSCLLLPVLTLLLISELCLWAYTGARESFVTEAAGYRQDWELSIVVSF